MIERKGLPKTEANKGFALGRLCESCKHHYLGCHHFTL